MDSVQNIHKMCCVKKFYLKQKKQIGSYCSEKIKPTLEIPFISTMEIRESLQSNIEINLEEEIGEFPEMQDKRWS